MPAESAASQCITFMLLLRWWESLQVDSVLWKNGRGDMRKGREERQGRKRKESRGETRCREMCQVFREASAQGSEGGMGSRLRVEAREARGSAQGRSGQAKVRRK